MNVQHTLEKVPFYDQKISVVIKGRDKFIVMKPICKNLELDWNGQCRKLLSHRDFEYRLVTVVSSDGKRRDMGCIPLKNLNKWLFSINVNKMRSPKLVECYQKECLAILENHVYGIRDSVNTEYALEKVPFHGQKITVVIKDGEQFVAMKPICENLNLDWPTQLIKLKMKAEKYGYWETPIPTKGGRQTMGCIPLKKINGWLFSINPDKTNNPGLIERYQEECFTVLYNYFNKGAAYNPAFKGEEPNGQYSKDKLMEVSLRLNEALLEADKMRRKLCPQAYDLDNIPVNHETIPDPSVLTNTVTITYLKLRKYPKERAMLEKYLNTYPRARKSMAEFYDKNKDASQVCKRTIARLIWQYNKNREGRW